MTPQVSCPVGARTQPAALGPGVPRHGRVRNELQELVLIIGMAAALGAIAWILFGPPGLVLVLTCALVMAFLRPRVSVALVLWIYQAQPLPRWATPQLHWMVDVLAERAHLRRPPSLFYIASPVPNAFVLGPPDHAALAVTDGLLRLLDGREVAGVLGHEISHLHNGDTSVMALSDLVARIAQWMAWIGLASSFFSVPVLLTTGDARPLLVTTYLVSVPTLVTLAQLALARSREYDADLTAAALTGDPVGLARALRVLDLSEGRIWERILVGRSVKPDPLLLQTHPRTEDRLRRLLALQAQQGPRPEATTRHVAPIGYPPVTHGPRLRRSGVRWFTTPSGVLHEWTGLRAHVATPRSCRRRGRRPTDLHSEPGGRDVDAVQSAASGGPSNHTP